MSLLNESHFIKECSITCRKRTDCINTSSHFLNNTQYVVDLFLFEFLLCTLRKTCISNITIIQTLKMIKPQALLPSKLHLQFFKIVYLSTVLYKKKNNHDSHQSYNSLQIPLTWGLHKQKIPSVKTEYE